MKCNVGKTEKIVRVIIGLILLLVGYFYNLWFSLIGIVLLMTAVVGFCPLTHLLGINTCKTEE